MLTYVQFHLNLKIDSIINRIDERLFTFHQSDFLMLNIKPRTYEMVMTLSHMYGGVVMSCLMFGL